VLAEAEELPAELLGVLLGFFIIGFCFKIASYPGHLWAADVYEGSPNSAFVFFALPSKIVTLTVFVTIMVFVYGDLYEI
jgi:NADH-quinone oxidoreductase subunit N